MNEWIIYQIGDEENRDKHRFIITFGFQDEAVEGKIKPTEFIDTISTLSGVLNGEALIIPLFTEAERGERMHEALRCILEMREHFYQDEKIKPYFAAHAGLFHSLFLTAAQAIEGVEIEERGKS